MIDYQKYINALRKCAKEHENDRTFTGHIIVSDLCRDTANLLKELEQEPRKGHWIEHPHEAGLNWEYSMYECSECHGWLENDSDYCPDCGAKMIELQENEEQTDESM